MSKEIPGFYYDEEKRKYFKILSSHVAPQGSKYSTEAVRKEKDRLKKREEYEQLQQRTRQTRIRRAPILNHIHGAALALDREVGVQSISSASMRLRSSIWARGLQRHRKSLEVNTHENIVQTILSDNATGCIITGGTSKDLEAYSVVSWAPKEGFDCPAEPIGRLMTYDFNQSVSTSMTPERLLISTTFGSSLTLNIIKLMDPEEFQSKGSRSIISESFSRHVPGPRSDSKQNTVNTVIFHSSANPDPSKIAAVAAGSDCGVLYLESLSMRPGHWIDEFYKTQSSVFSVAWLSDTVLSAGCRNGKVWLFDRRSGGRVQRLRHPSSVTHIKKADGSRLVVAGLENNLHTYDLRFPNELMRKKLRPSPTQPYLSYPAYKNMSLHSIGFDISPSLGLVSAATDDNRVLLFDTWTGKECKSNPALNTKQHDRITSLKFVDDNPISDGVGEGRSAGLLIGKGEVVEKWVWSESNRM